MLSDVLYDAVCKIDEYLTSTHPCEVAWYGPESGLHARILAVRTQMDALRAVLDAGGDAETEESALSAASPTPAQHREEN
jgi:hypothetical protein